VNPPNLTPPPCIQLRDEGLFGLARVNPNPNAETSVSSTPNSTPSLCIQSRDEFSFGLARVHPNSNAQTPVSNANTPDSPPPFVFAASA